MFLVPLPVRAPSPLPDNFPASLPHPHFKMGGIRRHLAAGPSSWPAATSPLHGWAAPREPPRVRWPWQPAREASCRLLAPESWAGTTRRPGWPKQAHAAPRVGSRAVVAIRRQAAGPEVVASRGVTPLFRRLFENRQGCATPMAAGPRGQPPPASSRILGRYNRAPRLA